MSRLTSNDVRVLDAIERASADYDGFSPHGVADWTAVRRFVDRGWLRIAAVGRCMDCEAHAFDQDVSIYALTPRGKRAAEATR